jgi:hypothetical protein
MHNIVMLSNNIVIFKFVYVSATLNSNGNVFLAMS